MTSGTTERRQGLNLGAGKLLRDSTDEIEWTNADVLPLPGIDLQMDAFRYPWPLPSSYYDEIYAGHLVEHIPHAFAVELFPWEASTVPSGRQDLHEWLEALRRLPDGLLVWFAEAWRVLNEGGEITCEVPWGMSVGALQDPGHTRQIITSTLSYLCNQPSETFDYLLPYRFEVTEVAYGVAPEYQGLPQGEVERLAYRLWNVIHVMRFTLRKVPLERDGV